MQVVLGKSERTIERRRNKLSFAIVLFVGRTTPLLTTANANNRLQL